MQPKERHFFQHHRIMNENDHQRISAILEVVITIFFVRAFKIRQYFAYLNKITNQDNLTFKII